MLIDLHNHTRISSPCSLLSPEELIVTARERGLEGICVTDHLVIEGANVAWELGKSMDYPVFRGIEARSQWGDMLVYGYYQDIPEGIPLEELCQRVHGVGGLVYAAHPYHIHGGANLWASLRSQGLDLDENWQQLPVLRELDGVEVLNGQVADEVNIRARSLAARLGIPGIGGSDAHSLGMIAKTATQFKGAIVGEAEFLAALRSGHFEPIRLAG